MLLKIKPLHQQVVFITGASGGIGLSTVHLAVEQGAKVFMVCRNEIMMQEIQNELSRKGYNTAFAISEVHDFDQLRIAVKRCLNIFGRIDTFINSTEISFQADLMDSSPDQARNLFDTNFWGVVNGSQLAVDVMRNSGGVIINISTKRSGKIFPHQAFYLISKRAVSDYSVYLKHELTMKKVPVELVLMSPFLMDTSPLDDIQNIAKTILSHAVNPSFLYKMDYLTSHQRLFFMRKD